MHGFLGNSEDLILVKNEIVQYTSYVQMMCSSANEDDTNQDLFEMGKNLAMEVKSMFDFDDSRYSRISFVSHSMGGLIVRAALPFLHEYSSKMFTYFSLATPHLGHIVSGSTLVDLGMWALKKWNKS